MKQWFYRPSIAPVFSFHWHVRIVFHYKSVWIPSPTNHFKDNWHTMTKELYIYYVYCTYREHGGRRSSILQNPSGPIYMSVCSFSNQFSKFIVPAHLPFQFIHNGLLFIESELKVIVGNTNLFCSSSFLETKL